jgi:hypothetical protein
VVRLITLARAGTVGGMGSHGDLERRRRGSSLARWMQCLRAAVEGLVSFTGSRRSYRGGCCGLRRSGAS